jgi:hypothetical protein
MLLLYYLQKSLSVIGRGAQRPITGVRNLTGDLIPSDLTNSAVRGF